MADFLGVFTAVFGLLQTKFTIYGFTISYWDVMIWFTVASIIISFIKGVLFSGD